MIKRTGLPDSMMAFCDCYEHALIVSWDWEDDKLCFAFWRRGYWEGGWRERLRHIWFIIKYGHPYYDEVILDSRKAKKMAMHVLAIARECEICGAKPGRSCSPDCSSNEGR